MSIPTFEERLKYLQLDGLVGSETFGWERYFNQVFYKGAVWDEIRRKVIIRDNGCDLGVPEHIITGKVIVHHMNPITIDDINERSEHLLSPEFLICVSNDTHQAIHYGKEITLPSYSERKPNDTCPWKA
jgi:hypothetical protein